MIDLKNQRLILASGSPRRKELLASLRIPFDIQPSTKAETYPDTLLSHEVPQYLAELKAKDIYSKQTGKVIVIGADTVVVWNDQILGKPKDKAEAIQVLSNLSDTAHDVFSGVCILSPNTIRSFTSRTTVYFSKLSTSEIERYIDECQPYDKAGSYGIQDWIGQSKIERLEGDYFNVMGFPITRVGLELKDVIKQGL